MASPQAPRPSPLDKPQYWYRPHQIIRRLRGRPARANGSGTCEVRLPWGVSIECWEGDVIGQALQRQGVYDLVVTEALFRLADRGECAIDAGANIGYMTSALAAAVGPQGRVIAVEPERSVGAVLHRNTTRWGGGSALSPIEVVDAGLSSEAGTGLLLVGEAFARNRGTASLVAADPTSAIADGLQQIPLTRLDDLVPAPEQTVGVLKIDIEGHELEALRGARRLIGERRLRDVVFEDLGVYPSPVSDFLEDHGYRVLGLGQTIFGPRTTPPSQDQRSWDPPTFIASIDPGRVQERLRPRGWISLRPSARKRRSIRARAAR